ncbi:hypothetical protein [Pseudomonas putida]|uniref:hypothetical protein n=1 Tax=Pseudomonas putida TaxID=303 RepID=UPI0009A14774|nr:hypothetical protein [Pseudomonas putida]
MSDFSCLNILKTHAKQLAQAEAIKLSSALERVAQQAGFSSYHELSEVAKRTPLDSRLIKAAFGVKDLRDALYENDVYSSFQQELDDQLSDATSEMNASDFEIRNVEVKSAEYSDALGLLTLAVSLAYQGTQDQDRMYHGTALYLDATLKVRRRDGEWQLADEGLSITGGESDADRDREAEWAHWAQAPGPLTMAEALAAEFELSVQECEELVDAEISDNSSTDGLRYGYWIDLEPVATGAVREKLMKRFGSLQLELNVNFFDNVDAGLRD